MDLFWFRDKSVVVIMARLDALNIFDKEENGFDSPSTGIVTLIATAEAIKKSLVNRLDFFFFF